MRSSCWNWSRVPSAARRLGAYPHELSGGLRQRAMIALALSCGPKLLLADEPTMALDATVQIQVLLLLRRLRAERRMAVIFVTHDLGVAAEIADHVAVMYAGRVVEEGGVADVLARPSHPYTMGVLASSVRRARPGEEIAAISGAPPDLRDLPPGCTFAPRCGFAVPACGRDDPPAWHPAPGRMALCLRAAGTRRRHVQPARPARRSPLMTDALPKVAFIGTGGTISSLGSGPLDILDYGASQNMLHAEAIVARVPELALVADVIPVRFRNVPSHRIFFPEWRELVLLCDRLVAQTPNLTGIVIGHGTASLEETAWFLGLTLKIDVPVVLVGSQRPASALSTDASMNLLNAVRVAASPASRGMGVLALLNDEIHAAREVTKTSTFRLQTFRSPDFGALGHADGDAVVFYRKPVRLVAPHTEFDVRGLASLPRVDIAYAYTGSDGAAVRAFLDAGAEGIVSAGFAPGFPGSEEEPLLREAAARGVIVVQSTRAGSGRTFAGRRAREAGFLVADNLNPQKARLLLALALTVSRAPDEIRRIFNTY